MTKNRRDKIEIRALQAATGLPYMQARRQSTATLPPSAKVEILPPFPGWTKPHSCSLWEKTAAKHGPLMAINISMGPNWWELDDLARAVASALQDDRPTEERGLWLHSGRFVVTKREHLDGIVAALDKAGALSRLTVREIPDAANCTHPSCRRRRGLAPLPPQDRPAPPDRAVRPALRATLTLAEVMEQHPTLGSNGLAYYQRGKIAEQRRADLAADRASLLAGEDRVQQAVAWLIEVNIGVIKKPQFSSYGLKHIMERLTRVYVTTGEFMAAALMLGYPYKENEGPNMSFAMSARDVRQLEEASLATRR